LARGYADEYAALLALLTGQPERAVRLLGATAATGELKGEIYPHPERAIVQRAMHGAREVLGQAEFDRAWADGQAMRFDQRTAEFEAVLNAAEARTESQTPAQATPFGLTPRELAILRLLPQGLSNSQIAEALFISPRTVQTHLSNLYGKLGVSGRAEAIAIAVQHGIT
jgi:DNA-binding NarL/FixJ family response regulator